MHTKGDPDPVSHKWAAILTCVERLTCVTNFPFNRSKTELVDLYMMAERTNSTVSRVSAHRKCVAEEPVTSVLKSGEVPYDPENPDREWNADEEVLAALGYKPEFKREFNLWSTFCVSFAVLGLLPSFASTLYYGMGYAGTAGMSCALVSYFRRRVGRFSLGFE